MKLLKYLYYFLLFLGLISVPSQTKAVYVCDQEYQINECTGLSFNSEETDWIGLLYLKDDKNQHIDISDQECFECSSHNFTGNLCSSDLFILISEPKSLIQKSEISQFRGRLSIRKNTGDKDVFVGHTELVNAWSSLKKAGLD